jgi:deazaflavin-dependent oxidoreductase (nitroreductase family)
VTEAGGDRPQRRTRGRLARPHGWSAAAFRAPAFLYRMGLGWLLGHRFLMLTTRGRRSGLPRQTILEVVEWDSAQRAALVLAAWGARSDWVRNLEAGPPIAVAIGRDRFRPTARRLGAEELEAALLRWRARHSWEARGLGAIVGVPAEALGTPEGSELLASVVAYQFRPAPEGVP